MLYKRNSFQIWVRIFNFSSIILASTLLLMIYVVRSLEEKQIVYPEPPLLDPVSQKSPSMEIGARKSGPHLISMSNTSSFLKVYQIPSRPILSDNSSTLFFLVGGKLYPVTSDRVYFDIQKGELIITDKNTGSYLEIKDRDENFLEIDQYCELVEPFSKQLHECHRLPIHLLKSDEIFSALPFSNELEWEFLGLNMFEDLKGNQVYLMKIDDQPYSIKTGDSLFFNKSWKIGASFSCPYIYFKEVSDEKVVMELWNENDSLYNSLELKKKYTPKKNLRISDIISDVHLRNKDQISFIVDKHKIFLKVGKIAVKRGEKWIHFSDEVDDFKNEMYIHLKEIKENRDIVINVLEKNRTVVHNFVVPISRGSFAKKNTRRLEGKS